MDALRRQQDRDVIAQGIAELEAGQGIPLAEALQAAAGRALGTQGMTVYGQIETLADFPESNGLSAENDEFPYEIRDKLLGLGSRPGYRAVFTIKADTVYVL